MKGNNDVICNGTEKEANRQIERFRKSRKRERKKESVKIRRCMEQHFIVALSEVYKNKQ